jgi:hypothetical protein
MLLWFLFFGWTDTILRTEAQFRKRCAKAELRLLAPAVLFPSPRHSRTPVPPDHTTVAVRV